MVNRVEIIITKLTNSRKFDRRFFRLRYKSEANKTVAPSSASIAGPQSGLSFSKLGWSE